MADAIGRAVGRSVRVVPTPTMPRNRRMLANQLRELAQFVVAPFSPGFNLERYDPNCVALSRRTIERSAPPSL